MRKQVTLLFALAIILNGAVAQRVDIDRMFCPTKYRHLPNKVLPADYKSYSVSASATVAIETYTNESFTNSINIVGLQRLPDGHIKVSVRFDDLIIESSEVKERVEVLKDKDGKETGRRYFYSAEVKYSFSASAAVTDYKNNGVLANYALARRDSKNVYATSEYDSYKKAADFYNNNKLEIKTSLIRSQLDAAVSNLNSNLNNDFGYYTRSVNPHVWYVDSKKHPEYQASQDVCKAVKAAFASVSAEDSLKGILESLKNEISYFEKLPSLYPDPEEKAHKKVRYMAYYSLAMIYFYLDQPAQAINYGQKIIENDYDEGDGKRIIREANELIEDFKKHGVTTRHFPIDLSNVQAPK